MDTLFNTSATILEGSRARRSAALRRWIAESTQEKTRHLTARPTLTASNRQL
jgi:hypothetical protein